MSNCPYLLPRVREGLRMGNGEVVDSMINDGLWCAFEQCHMGNCRRGRRRAVPASDAQAQDDYAARSHQKAAHATDARARSPTRSCRSRSRRRRATPIVVDRDESIRADTTAEALARAEAGVQEGRHVTAGNAPGVNDGASALVVMAADARARSASTPLARIVGAGDERPARRSSC